MTIVVVHLHGTARQDARHAAQVAAVIRHGEAVGVGRQLLGVDNLHELTEVLEQEVRVVEIVDSHTWHPLEAVERPAQNRLGEAVDAVACVLLSSRGVVDTDGITRHDAPCRL